jgi:polygalacturonase
VGNNYYQNVTILKDKKIFYFFSERSNITIRNETLINNTLDDLYTIGSAKNVFVEDFRVMNNDNTGAITETSAILRISTAANLC